MQQQSLEQARKCFIGDCAPIEHFDAMTIEDIKDDLRHGLLSDPNLEIDDEGDIEKIVDDELVEVVGDMEWWDACLRGRSEWDLLMAMTPLTRPCSEPARSLYASTMNR